MINPEGCEVKDWSPI